MRDLCRIPYKFIPHQRLVIGKGDADIALFPGLHRQRRQFLRIDPLRTDPELFSVRRLRDLMILAERTFQIASQAAG